MDSEDSPLLTGAYYCQGKSTHELRQSLLLTTLELESTRLNAQEELKFRDDQLNHLKRLLAQAIRERDQAQNKYQTLFFEKISLQKQQICPQTGPISGISSIEDEPRRGFSSLDSNNGFSFSDCEESHVSSAQKLEIPAAVVVADKLLPEKGKLLEAVMGAGPLLQTLLVAGQMPRWRHPPPPLDTHQIPPPPVAIPLTRPPQVHHQDSLLDIENCGGISKKRGFCEGFESPTETKYQRLVYN
ncbi:enabled-like protein [Actinidia rufa]|uniref:Enabled-like protein n=1 Tax=Actinidia rufa TaxID=165716 RepID=A0A7J0GQC8_9ERIC|nr:enabled-like protein [Actinidia rufa]